MTSENKNDRVRTSKNPPLHENNVDIGENDQNKLFENSGNVFTEPLSKYWEMYSFQ